MYEGVDRLLCAIATADAGTSLPSNPAPPPQPHTAHSVIDSFVFNITHYLRNFMGFSSDQSISVKLAWNFVGWV